ncbi:very short patch repair endonuclease [Geodermatophilus sp. YIM 151500]|uniref:very short patch repair endonuclease n=1 Tax=Geodermatophilus sp. YIM 151500 TaxID=2984531 RepID=UPI0021E505EE|nr:very short patch repair endonuclease [Geodermatophilus sp. YIM 151500]MCV2488251.1 very short patch repair endonuclease [Geodermatophilus sp. YIM 151500]
MTDNLPPSRGGKPSWASSAAAQRVMRGNRHRDSRPELAVRRAAHALGLRYRVATAPLAGVRRTADLVFPGQRVAVFVDGCFWHGCPRHYVASKTNRDFWDNKIAANRLRDNETNELLDQAGWVALRFWAHEEPASVATQIYRVVHKRRTRKQQSTPQKHAID